MDSLVAVSVVVPTLNEAGNIDRLLEEVFAACGSGPAIEVVVVDDGSTDGTREKVLAWSQTHPVRLVARVHERGQAGAVLAGAEAAVGGAIVVIDADLSHPPACIPDLARPEGTSDMVIGSRYVPALPGPRPAGRSRVRPQHDPPRRLGGDGPAGRGLGAHY